MGRILEKHKGQCGTCKLTALGLFQPLDMKEGGMLHVLPEFEGDSYGGRETSLGEVLRTDFPNLIALNIQSCILLC